MPAWVNAFDRKPLKFGKYHVKLNGVKEVITYFEFDRMMERYDTVEWLDDELNTPPTVIQPKPKQKTLIEQLVSGELCEKHSNQLSNLFGIDRAAKIKEKMKCQG